MAEIPVGALPTVIAGTPRDKHVARTGNHGRTEIVRVIERQRQNRAPNFTSEGSHYLVRCFTCGGERGRENYAPAVATGQCAWCGDHYDNGVI